MGEMNAQGDRFFRYAALRSFMMHGQGLTGVFTAREIDMNSGSIRGKE